MKNVLSVVRPLATPLLLTSTMLLASCGGGGGTGPSVSGFAVIPGDGRLIGTWDQQSGINYTAYYRAGTSAASADIADNATAITYGVIQYAQSPAPLSVLNAALMQPWMLNGTEYAATMNAKTGTSAAGPDAPVQTGTPRLAGQFWTNPNNSSDTSWQQLSSSTALSAPAFKGRLAANTTGNLRAVAVSPEFSYTNLNTNTTLNTSSYVVAGDAGFLAASSDNGLTWHAINGTPVANSNASSFTGPASNYDFKALAYNDVNQIFAVGCQTYGSNCASPLVYMATGGNGNVGANTDTSTWSTLTNLPTISGNTTLNGVTRSSLGILAVGDGGAIISTGDSGGSWSVPSSLPNTSATWNAVACGGALNIADNSGDTNNICVVVGDAGAAAYSTNGGSSWTALATGGSDDLLGVSFGVIATGSGSSAVLTPTFVAVSKAGNAWRLPVSTSSNTPTTWTETAGAFGSTQMNAIVYGNQQFLSQPDYSNGYEGNLAYFLTGYQQFIAVGNGGAIYYSIDGVNWSQPTGGSGPASDLYAITHTSDQTHQYYEYYAVGAGGTSITAN